LCQKQPTSNKTFRLIGAKIVTKKMTRLEGSTFLAKMANPRDIQYRNVTDGFILFNSINLSLLNFTDFSNQHS